YDEALNHLLYLQNTFLRWGADEKTLDRASDALEDARVDENWDVAAPSVKAYLRFERARLFVFARRYDEARDLFKRLLSEFEEFGDELKRHHTEEYLMILTVLETFTAGGTSEIWPSDLPKLGKMLCQNLIQGRHKPCSPLASFFFQVVREG